MAEIIYQEETRAGLRPGINWSAIWAGLFTFIAIWSVFGFLGFAIFNTGTNAGAALAAPSVGLGIWAIVLTAVAMYIAGRETGRVAAVEGAYPNLAHGMVMFGLSVAAAIVLTVSGRTLFIGLPVANLAAPGPYVRSVFGGSEWMAFLALLLGWLGAMLGATTATARKPISTREVKDIRPAA